MLNGISVTLRSLLLVGSALTSSLTAMAESFEPPLPSYTSGSVKIVCFGDSVTGLYYHTGGRRTYTNLLGSALQQSLPQANIQMHNAGISGNTTVDALTRIESDVLSHHPDLVTIMFGLNDMVRVPLDEYRANLVSLIQQCRDAGAQVILATPNAITDNPTRPTALLLEYCDAVRSVAAEYQVTLCDSYEAFTTFRDQNEVEWRLMMSDEIHPNLAGHQFIAEKLAGTIIGQPVSLKPLSPSLPAIPRLSSLTKSASPFRILAMPPYDAWIGAALNEVTERSDTDVVTWVIEKKSLLEIEADAESRVRPMQPDLVLIAVPREIPSESLEATIHAYSWIANWSQHFATREWGCVIVHPDVLDPHAFPTRNDKLVRRLAIAGDLPLIDRERNDHQTAAELLTAWVRAQVNESPSTAARAGLARVVAPK